MSSTLPPPHVLEALRHARRSLPKTNLAGLRKWIATTDAGVLIGGEVVLALWEEFLGERPLYFDKPRILKVFVTLKELETSLGDLLIAVMAGPD
jgi:hypothetical protein